MMEFPVINKIFTYLKNKSNIIIIQKNLLNSKISEHEEKNYLKINNTEIF